MMGSAGGEPNPSGDGEATMDPPVMGIKAITTQHGTGLIVELGTENGAHGEGAQEKPRVGLGRGGFRE